MDLFVINLPDSRTRLLQLQESLNSLGIPFRVHNAAKGSSLLRADYPGSDSLRAGELGCAVSHYQLYEKFAERPERIFCILEDDVRPSKTLKQVLGHFEANPPPAGVVVLLSAAFTHLHFIEITTILSSKLKIGVIKELPGGLGSAGAYILSGETAASLCLCRKAHWSFAADSWTNYYRSGALKEIWLVLPYPAPPSFNSESTIGYVPNKPGLIQFVKGSRFFGLLRNFNRRRVWMSKQIPKRISSYTQGDQYFTKAKGGFLEFKKFFNSLFQKLTIGLQVILVKAGLSKSIICSAGRILIRRHTSDLSCFRQVFIQHEYAIRLPLNISSVVDLGANSGMFGRYIKARFPNARLIAVEPEPQNYKALQLNLARLESSFAINAAIWSEEAQLQTEFTTGGEWGARTTPVTTGHGDKSVENCRTVPGMTLEMLMKKTGLATIDLLKVDIEGAEIELFKGDCSWLRNVGVMAIELHDWITPGCSKAVCASISTYLDDFSISWRGENLIIYNNQYIACHLSAK